MNFFHLWLKSHVAPQVSIDVITLPIHNTSRDVIQGTRSSYFSLVKAFHDIKEIRSLSDEYSTSPLLLPQLVIVTHWKCHYLAFCNEQMRSNFHGSLNSAIFSNSSNFAEQNEWQAHFWQGFNFMAGMNNTSKWDKIIVSNKQQHRLVLNSRRMSFDCDRFLDVCDYGHINEISAFVEDLLNMSLSFTSENLETSPEEFIKFQDKTSRLKNLPVQKLDRSKVETFCIWVNLYHCLLQHSLLLSSRAPTKVNFFKMNLSFAFFLFLQKKHN